MVEVVPDLSPPAPDPPAPPEDPAAILENRRSLVRVQVMSLLQRSDGWAVRHVEDGVSLTPERIAYRQKLRALLSTVDSSTAPEDIQVPDPPPPPATRRRPPAAADVVLGALNKLGSGASVADAVTAVKGALNVAAATPIDPATVPPPT